MKNNYVFLVLICLAISFYSCELKPEPIHYGMDVCGYCSMTIVDRQRASQVVSDKGRVVKFDAIECMVNHLEEVDYQNVGMILCATYNEPGELMDATKATYLISPELPSPMGENLTAFGDKRLAMDVQKDVTGNLYTWQELTDKFAP